MAEKLFKSKLKQGESITGRVEDIDTDKQRVTLEHKDETLTVLSGLPDSILEEIDDEYDGDIITIKHRDSGEYSITELDDFPDDEKKK